MTPHIQQDFVIVAVIPVSPKLPLLLLSSHTLCLPGAGCLPVAMTTLTGHRHEKLMWRELVFEAMTDVTMRNP